MTFDLNQNAKDIQTLQEERRAYQKEQNRLKQLARSKERTDCRIKLEKAYYDRLPANTEVLDIMFQKAWNDGHAQGIAEVEWHYDDLVDFVELVWTEAQKNCQPQA